MFDWPTENEQKTLRYFCPSDHITVKVRISTSRTLTWAKVASDRSDPPARGPSPPRQFSTREVWLGLVLFSEATRSCWELCSHGTYLKQKSWMLTSYLINFISTQIYYFWCLFTKFRFFSGGMISEKLIKFMDYTCVSRRLGCLLFMLSLCHW